MITISQIIDKAKVHLETVTSERSLYRSACKSSRDSLKTMFTAADVFQPPSPSSFLSPKSHNITVHYSFDMAQQVKKTTSVHTCISVIRFIIPVIHCSLAQFTFWQHGNVVYLVYAVRLYPDRQAFEMWLQKEIHLPLGDLLDWRGLQCGQGC